MNDILQTYVEFLFECLNTLFKIFELICTYILSILNGIPHPEGNGR